MVKIPNFKKTLLRPETPLQVGDGLLEMDRFKTFYHIYEIVSFDGPDWFYCKIVDSSIKNFNKEAFLGCDRESHTTHKHFTVLTYYLPNYKILYGKKV